ncbi:unnamed protein product [Brassicogethes aeneus]|uniref:protein disulfide-isomerase n=1 Tax=Brassicogethes aeneus TaxID=1431903 RepID=A0A9P0B2R4_BRAAE|nr:unnamed protein product [Brassicogethes aeneus]
MCITLFCLLFITFTISDVFSQDLLHGECKNPDYVPKDSFQLAFEEKRDLNPFVFTNNLVPEALKLDLKSEDTPSANDDNVKVAVGRNFYDMVVNNGKDTIVALYAPWCKYCQALLPQFDNLADMLKNENVAVVKMDASKNEVPANYDVPSYPTIYWASRDSKYFPKKYEGPRTAQAMLKFIALHSTHELKTYDRRGSLKSMSIYNVGSQNIDKIVSNKVI